MLKTALLEDMLKSIKRLNKELDSRCDFESGLITRIDELQKVIKTKDKQIAKLNTRIKTADVRVAKFNKFITEHVLPENQQIVFNLQTEDFELIEK